MNSAEYATEQSKMDKLEAPMGYDMEKTMDASSTGDSQEAEDLEYDMHLPEDEMDNSRILTLRVLVIATVFNFLWSYVNQIGNYRTVPFSLDSSVAYLVSYPVLKFLAASIPSYKWKIGGYTLDTNPGPFNIQEHLMVGVVTSDSVNGAYVANTLYFMEKKLGQNIGWFGDFMLILVTKMIGYGLAALCYRFLIISKNMPWPTAIYTAEIFKMLHEDSNKRLKVFGIFFAVFFCYMWLPGYFWPGLISVSVLCWVASGTNAGPSSKLQVLGRGASQGFGVGTLMFDISVFTAFYNFLMYVPAWLGFNAVAGGMLYAWVITPIMYYQDFAHSQNFDPKGLDLYMKNGTDYPLDLLFNDNLDWQQDVYDTYGFAYLSGFNSMGYFFSFMALTAAISHTLVWHWDDVRSVFSNNHSQKSKHAVKLEQIGKGHTIPYWVGFLFMAVFAAAFIGTNQGYDISMPWWAVIVSVLLAAIFIIPIGAILSVTGNMLGLNIICEMIGGLMLHHNPNGAILVKVTGYMGMYHGLTLVQNMKVGQFMHVNYHVILAMQAWGTLVTSLADTTAYRNVMDANLTDGTHPDWDSTNLEIYTTASYLWGGIGPYEAWMSSDSPYQPLFISGLVLGFVLPPLFWMLSKKINIFKWIHIPMMTLMPTFGNINSWFLTTLAMVVIFQVILPRHFPNFYKNHLYVSAAGMIGGVGIGSFVISMLTGFAHVTLDNLPEWTNADAGCGAMTLPSSYCTVQSYGNCVVNA
eukprot:Nk52_evm7s2377 gene=Nk52_evmTU7s2377